MSVSHGPGSVSFPEWPALASGTGTAMVMTADGEVLRLDTRATAKLLDSSEPPLLIHAPATWRRLGLKPMPAYDLLELFAFVRPAKPAVPTARGLAQTLEMRPVAQGLEAAAASLPNLAVALLDELSRGATLPANRDLPALAKRMGMPAGCGDPWCWRRWPAEAGCRHRAKTAMPSASGAACRNGRKGRRRPHPPPCPSRPPKPGCGWRGWWATAPKPARARPITPLPPRRPSPRAKRRARPISCWPRPARVPARRWAMSRPRASGPSAIMRRSGFQPSPAICNARWRASWSGFFLTPSNGIGAWCCARAAKTICVCSIWRMRSPRRWWAAIRHWSFHLA